MMINFEEIKIENMNSISQMEHQLSEKIGQVRVPKIIMSDKSTETEK